MKFTIKQVLAQRVTIYIHMKFTIKQVLSQRVAERTLDITLQLSRVSLFLKWTLVPQCFWQGAYICKLVIKNSM